MTDKTFAQQQAEALRAIADVIDANPEIAVMVSTSLRHMVTHIFEDGAKEKFATFIRACKEHGAVIDKRYTPDYAVVEAKWGHVTLGLQTEREQVCERVVTGTETVTTKQRDPDAVKAALAEIPEVEVEEVVETFEWVCSPLLAESGVSA